MRKDFKAKTIVMPCPVLIISTYDENNKPDVMNAAWGGTYDENQIFICLSSSHKTTKNIELNKEFTVAFGEVKNEAESDYFGIVSGNDGTDKIKKVGFTVTKASRVNAPIINEYSLTLECKVNRLSYDESKATTYVVADIVSISCDESILTDGKIDASKLHLISFNPISNTYDEMKGEAGKAFKDGLKFR